MAKVKEGAMNNPPKDKTTTKRISAARQKILDDAMKQLKKTRGEMDPSIFTKIRAIIAKNPKVMKALGLSKLPEKVAKPQLKALQDREAKQDLANAEKIDQEKNLDIIAKFMTIKPSGREGIKSIIKKSQDEKSKD